jgi:hypothetical protein
LISVPLQNNFNFGTGDHHNKMWHALNVHPVIPSISTTSGISSRAWPEYGPKWQLRFQLQFLFSEVKGVWVG